MEITKTIPFATVSKRVKYLGINLTRRNTYTTGATAGCGCSIAQSCLALCDPMHCSPTRLLCPRDFPGKSTVAISFSREYSPPRD